MSNILTPIVPPTYLPGRHVSADLSDVDPGDTGEVRCIKCLAVRHFSVGPRWGLRLGPWTREGRRKPRCTTQKVAMTDKNLVLPLVFHYTAPSLLAVTERQRDADLVILQRDYVPREQVRALIEAAVWSLQNPTAARLTLEAALAQLGVEVKP